MQGNRTTVARVFDVDVQTVRPDRLKHDSAVARYRCHNTVHEKVTGGLSVSYPTLTHAMCVAHASERVRETSRVLYTNVDKFVANGSKIFVE
jgi:hypothetical protein